MVDVIVIGLDGANWNLVDPWLESGRLPNLQSLRRSGTSGDLRSCLPPVTCPNWRCYSTGKNPGKLGTYWWERIDTQARSLSTPNSRSFRSANYWDYLNDEGYSAGVMNLPMTYPPLDIDGFLIAGGPGTEATDYARPASLEATLEDRGYNLHPPRSIRSPDDRDAAEGILELIDQRFETFQDLLRERSVDVAHLTIFYSNVLQHWFWRDEPTERAWTIIDEHLGAIREAYPEATLVLMSDHGCRDIETVFYANSWLEREGYLVTEGDDSLFQRMGISKERIMAAIEPWDVLQWLASHVPEPMTDQIPEDDDGFKRGQKLDRVDWDRSRAIASGQGLIYTIDEDAAPEIRSALESTQSPITGDSIAAGVYDRDEVYEGPFVDLAPEIVFEQAPGVHTPGVVGDNPVFSEPSGWQAENVTKGLYLVDAPDLDQAGPDEASITDIAPTILHFLDCAIPADVDGEPLGICDGEPTERDPIPYEGAREQGVDESIESQLEELGYLG